MQGPVLFFSTGFFKLPSEVKNCSPSSSISSGIRGFTRVMAPFFPFSAQAKASFLPSASAFLTFFFAVLTCFCPFYVRVFLLGAFFLPPGQCPPRPLSKLSLGLSEKPFFFSGQVDPSVLQLILFLQESSIFPLLVSLSSRFFFFAAMCSLLPAANILSASPTLARGDRFFPPNQRGSLPQVLSCSWIIPFS